MSTLLDTNVLIWADPFDMALVAQAVAKRMTLLTGDRKILKSQVEGLVAMDASK